MNYHEILGIDRNSNVDDIKKAYKKLSLKYHPDNQDTGNSEKFIKIKDAYDNLIKHRSQNNSFNNIFNDLFRRMNKNVVRQHSITVKITLDEAINGVTKDLLIQFNIPCECSSIARSVCKKCGGFGYLRENLRHSFSFTNITRQRQTYRYEKIYKDFDLQVSVIVADSADFRLRDNFIYREEKLNIFRAMIGGRVPVKTIKGEARITVPSRNIADFKMNLHGAGLRGGDQIIHFKLFMPKDLTNKQKELLNSILDEKESNKT